MSRGMWLGFLFFVAMVLVGFGTLLVGNIRLFKKSYPLEVRFDRVEGLRPGDDVRVEGVQFGKVKTIELNARNGVKVLADLDGPLELCEDYQIFVEAVTVIGGNYLSIKRGTRGKNEKPLVGNARASALTEVGSLVSENREAFRELISNLRDVSAAIRDSRGSLGKVVNDSALYEKLLKTMEDAQSALADLRKLPQTLIHELEQGEGPIRTLLRDKEMSERLKQITKNVEEVTQSVKNMTAQIESGQGMAGTLLYNKEAGEQLKKTLENVEKISDSIRKLTDRMEGSTVGKLLTEDRLYKQAEKGLEDLDKVLGRAAQSKIFVHTEGKFYPTTNHVISRIGLRIEPDDTKYFYGGVAFIALNTEGGILEFENLVQENDDQLITKFEFGVAYKIPWILDKRIAVRAGLIEGKPGGAIEFRWDDWGWFQHPVQFTFDIRDAYNDVADEQLDENIRGSMMQFWLDTALWNRPEAWWQKLLSYTHIFVGVSRIGSDEELLAGVGMEWEDEDIKSLVSLLGLGR